MKLIPFGQTHLKVSRIGLGLAAIGRPGYINIGHGNDLNGDYSFEKMQDTAFKLLDLAHQKGINYFDAARSYGKAEAYIGNWLQINKQTDDVIIGSKWGYTYTAGWQVHSEKHEVKEHSWHQLKKQWSESNSMLTQPPDIYHIHSATLESKVLENQSILDTLWKMKESGTVIGLSLSGSMQNSTLEKALQIENASGLLFQSIQVTWNLLEQSTTALLKEASIKGCGIIVKEGLANGRLTLRNKSNDMSEKLHVLNAIAHKYKVGIDALALACILKQSWVSVVLSGACTEAHLLDNLKAGEINLSDEDLAMCCSMAEDPKHYWDNRARMDWN